MTSEKALGNDGEPVNEKTTTLSVWPNDCVIVTLENMAMLFEIGNESEPDSVTPSLGRTETANEPEQATVARQRTKIGGIRDAFITY